MNGVSNSSAECFVRSTKVLIAQLENANGVFVPIHRDAIELIFALEGSSKWNQLCSYKADEQHSKTYADSTEEPWE